MPTSAITVALLALLLTCWTCLAGQQLFDEVWAYLYKGEERVITGQEQLTDLCYFSTSLDDTGRLAQPPARPDLGQLGRIRVHLVVSAPSNKALMYFCLTRDRQTRDALIEDIVAASKTFDGIQIDFESVRPEDRQPFLSFLTLLRLRLPAGKVLSITVPARTAHREDAYGYASIGQIADKVVVMAYDEHWQGGQPGPICSLQWCRRVCQFAMQEIPPRKLIIGLPLYGRAWQVVQYSRALRFQQTMELLLNLGKSPNRDEDRIPSFEYLEPVRVKVFYEDMESILAKLDMCTQLGVKGVGFWRLGQGPNELWQVLRAGGQGQ